MNSVIKKHFQGLIYLVSCIMIAVAIAMNIGAHRIYFDVVPIQLGETTGLPYNIGFRWSSLMMVVSILLFSMCFFVLLRCRSSFRMEVVQLIILLLCCVGANDYVFDASKLKLAFLFHSSNQLSFSELRVWSNVWTYTTWALYALNISMLGRLLFVVLGKKFQRKSGKGLIFSVITTVILVVMFIARGVSNTWYLVECLALIVLSLLLMRVMRIIWNNHKLDDLCSDKSFFDYLIKDDSVYEDFGDLNRLYQEKEIMNCECILYLIKHLEEKGYSDTDIKDAIVSELERHKLMLSNKMTS